MMQKAGVALEFDLTEHSVIGLWEVLKKYFEFRRLFRRLLDVAFERQPDVIVCVDFAGFNRRFAAAVRKGIRERVLNWRPKIVQYVSPQVWASRPKRADSMARDLDLLLTILPFEKAWYAQRVPQLRAEFVGHPIVERHASAERFASAAKSDSSESGPVTVVLLPGSRRGEIKRHWPVMLAAWAQLHAQFPAARAVVVFPNERIRAMAEVPADLGLTPQIGGLAAALREATVAIASTGTVTLECAWFGVPTVALYKTSWLTFEIGRRIVQVKFLAMPNLLANAPLFPEFIQNDATAANLARATGELIAQPQRRAEIRAQLAKLCAALGEPGASQRAAAAIRSLA
jgi:lipid-A-disaccharide synthase